MVYDLWMDNWEIQNLASGSDWDMLGAVCGLMKCLSPLKPAACITFTAQWHLIIPDLNSANYYQMLLRY